MPIPALGRSPSSPPLWELLLWWTLCCLPRSSASSSTTALYRYVISSISLHYQIYKICHWLGADEQLFSFISIFVLFLTHWPYKCEDKWSDHLLLHEDSSGKLAWKELPRYNPSISHHYIPLYWPGVACCHLSPSGQLSLNRSLMLLMEWDRLVFHKEEKHAWNEV